MGEPVNPKDIAATRDQKPPLHLLEHSADVEIAKVMAHGAEKYGRRNFYTIPILANVYGGAIRRHIGAWLMGEDIDPESGHSHLAHIGANIHVLFAAMQEGMFLDDRGPECQSEVQKRLSDASNSGGNVGTVMVGPVSASDERYPPDDPADLGLKATDFT